MTKISEEELDTLSDIYNEVGTPEEIKKETKTLIDEGLTSLNENPNIQLSETDKRIIKREFKDYINSWSERPPEEHRNSKYVDILYNKRMNEIDYDLTYMVQSRFNYRKYLVLRAIYRYQVVGIRPDYIQIAEQTGYPSGLICNALQEYHKNNYIQRYKKKRMDKSKYKLTKHGVKTLIRLHKLVKEGKELNLRKKNPQKLNTYYKLLINKYPKSNEVTSSD